MYNFVFIIIPLLFMLLATTPLSLQAKPVKIVPRYELAISFDAPNATMSGTAHISLPPDVENSFSVYGIDVTGILLHRDGEETLTMELPKGDTLVVPKSRGWQEVYISYTKKVENSYANRIKEDGIVLTADWYPQLEEKVYFTLKSTLPKGFVAFSESDSFSFNKGLPQDTFHLSRPLAGIHFVAAKYKVNSLKIRNNLTIYTLFFDKKLAQDFLEATRNYIQRYEEYIGPFPYNHYAVVENHLPTGYGMPTFTLLGQAVIRLPFIKETSLGHEVLHSWFGNSVGVAQQSGNWCEGLTSYLADWTYRIEKGQGAEVRKENIQKYLSYNPEKASISLSEFNSVSHVQPMALAKRSVGYSRSAMFFHELRKLLNPTTFQKGIRHFYFSNAHKTATWKDIQKSFEVVSGKDLTRFFTERLLEKDIPEISIENITTVSFEDGIKLSFNLIQKTKKAWSFNAEFEVKTANKSIRFTQAISEQNTHISFKLPTAPLALVFDPNYDMLRRLHQQETSPLWSDFLGSAKKLIILSSEQEREIYEPLLQKLTSKETTVTTADKVTNSQLSGSTILFLGINNSASRSLFALPGHPETGFTLDVRSNPLDPTYTAVLISSQNKDQTKQVAQRLSHYGKYSYLHFENGKIQTKFTHKSSSGQRYLIEELPTGSATSAFSDFSSIMKELANKKVIFVGETHTSPSDHRLQYRIIEALASQNPHLVIGMEMFPESSQPALDEYLLSDNKMDERTFLKKSHYFEVWRYDWRFFQDIFNFAKSNRIPVRGLNLDRVIVSHVFKKGHTDGLEDDVLKSLPEDRDLSIHGYQHRLSTVHDFHVQGGHGKGMMSGFIQAQALWDETMAENISSYLSKHPQAQMVVLAGSQHTRNDSGIPPRVARRMDIPLASVLNIHTGHTPANAAELADYVFLGEEYTLPSPGKIGVVLNTVTLDSKSYLQISQLSPHGKAGDAGLKVKDIILSIDGYKIHEMEDIQIAMVGAKVGEKVSLEIRRKKEEEFTEKFTTKVELYSPQKGKPHR